MVRNDPIVGLDSMVVADLSRLSLANCNTVVPVSSDMSILNHIDDSSGLPLLKVKVNGKNCSVLLDTGSRLNLVSKSFLVNKLGINSEKIRSTNVLVKGVSGSIFQAAGEIDLSFSLVGGNFDFKFIVLSNKTFPADLLLSYTSIKSFIFPHDPMLSLAISDSSRLPNQANLVGDESMNETESECRKCVIDCLYPDLHDSVGNSTVFTSSVSFNSDDDTGVNDDGDMCMLQIVTGKELFMYKQAEENVMNANCPLDDVSSKHLAFKECCFSEVSDNSRVGLVGINENISSCARTTRDVVLVPNELTKVYLRCEEAANEEVLVLNEKFLHDDVSIETAIVNSVNGNFFVYARSTNGMSINLWPGSRFCDVVILKHKMVALSQEIFPSLCVGDGSDDLRREMEISDYSEATEDLIKLLHKFRGTIALSGDSLGRTDILKHSIALKNGVTHFFVPSYRLPIGRRQAVDDLISDMKKEGVVTESKSPYNSPLLLVPKKDGTWRLVVDYRKLNSFTIPDRMPMPILDEVLASLNGATVFSSLDLLSGYWQVPLDEASKPLTAFSTHREHLQFEVLPFGLCNAPLTFVRLMKEVLEGIPNILCYIDDILVFSRDVDSHLHTLELVLERLKKAGLKVKLKKCHFLKREVDFLGHKVSGDGLSMQGNKIKAILDYPAPKNIKTLRRFLGISGYYRSFIKGYASIAFPLTSLLKADKDFVWGNEQQKAFVQLKERLVQAPILSYPDFKSKFYVACDASNVGVGAVLLQKGDRRLMPISFASRVLSPAERNYSVTEKELLAVVWSLKKFRHTILGFPVQIITDHRPVVDLFKKRAFVENSKFNRWFISVLEFNPDFKYIPGRYNTIADGLSRVAEEEVSNQSKTYYSFLVENTDLDMNIVREEQEKDPEVRNIVAKLLSTEENCSNYILINRLLYLKPNKEGGCARLFVPESLRRRVLELVHSHRLSGHPGIAKTVRHLGRNFFWPKCRQYVKNFVTDCQVCQVHKGVTNKPAPLEIYPSQLLPFHTISMDIMGPFPVTEEGFRYILVFIDYLSRYTELCPIKEKSSIAVAESLRHRIITRHSCPKVLISDNAKEFTSDVIQNLCKAYGINKCQVLPYRPSSNGLVERANKSIISILRTVITPKTVDWHLVLDDVQMTLNNSVNESVGESPHYLLYGYDGRMPHNVLDDVVSPRPTYNYEDYVAYRTKRSYDIIKNVRETLSKSTLSRKSRFDKATVMPSAKIGQKVYVIKHVKDGPLTKLSPKYEGPYRVVEILRNNKYKLRHCQTGVEKTTHWNFIKLIKKDVDVSFLNNDNDDSNMPALLQVRENEAKSNYNLRSRSSNL